jgi:hypothetical protein
VVAAAARFASVENRLPLLPLLTSGRNLEANSRRIARRRAGKKINGRKRHLLQPCAKQAAT